MWHITLLLFLLIGILGTKGKTFVCENDKTTISCPEPRTSIDVTFAAYGRTSTSVCSNTHLPHSRTDCIRIDNKVLDIVKSICNGKKSCELEAKNGVFGDTCGGTYKYLEVAFECKSDSTNVCEGQQKTISCPEPHTSIDVTFAAYGRTSTSICSNTNLPHSRTDCIRNDNKVLNIVKNKCNGKKSCELEAKNSMFGDTCGGTYKYLEVVYECKSDSTNVCEGQKKTISCSEPRTSIDVSFAAYGRTSTSVCSNTHLPHSRIDCIRNDNKVLDIVKNKCNGKKSCELEAKNSVFGDTCGGTYKYLEVVFECKSDSTNVCEGQKKTITCSEPRTSIDITFATYGRTSTSVCSNTHLPHSRTDCVRNDNKVLDIVNNICNGKKTCELEAKNGVFGDTCGGTYKYLEVAFECKSDSTNVCEGQQKTIICPEPRTSIDVTFAAYGRTSTSVCSNTHLPHSRTDCIRNDNKVLDSVKNICNGKKTCELEAKNSVFGDTCVGTYKYLEVVFECKRNSTTICEHDKKTISCPEPGTAIATTFAAYGRTSTNVCSDTPLPHSKTDCVRDDNQALEIVKDKCDGMNFCELYASNIVFGDTCRGTYKYLEIAFECKGLHNLAYNKTTHQTGLRKGKPKFRSSMAIDGNIKTCAKTDRRSNPMWTIDLGAPAIVSGITLKRLGPGQKEKGVKVTVYVGSTSTDLSQVCSSYFGPSVDIYTFICPANTQGRHVIVIRDTTKIKKNKTNKTKQRRLRICEAEVIGYFV